MDYISEHLNYSNAKIHSYDQMIKIIVNLVSTKCKNNNNSTCQLSCLHNLLFMSIVDTPEKDLSDFDRESDMRKLHKSSVKSSLPLFSCSIRAIYNRISRTQKQHIMLKSYLHGINTLIFPNRYNDNIFSGKLVN